MDIWLCSALGSGQEGYEFWNISLKQQPDWTWHGEVQHVKRGGAYLQHAEAVQEPTWHLQD